MIHVPPIKLSFNIKKPVNNIKPITAVKNTAITVMNKYLIYLGTFLLLLAAIPPSKINSNINSKIKSITITLSNKNLLFTCSLNYFIMIFSIFNILFCSLVLHLIKSIVINKFIYCYNFL